MVRSAKLNDIRHLRFKKLAFSSLKGLTLVWMSAAACTDRSMPMRGLWASRVLVAGSCVVGGGDDAVNERRCLTYKSKILYYFVPVFFEVNLSKRKKSYAQAWALSRFLLPARCVGRRRPDRAGVGSLS